jgi:dinuclear metal center YbgI/SA1388 family protein
MATVGDVAAVLEQLAPLALAEAWDNVGLLVGDASWPADRVMTCLTLTPDSVAEAVQKGANLVVSHHPLPFHPIRSVTTQTTVGRLLLALIKHSIAVYSPHTAFDSAAAGINQHLAIGLGLQEIRPLRPLPGAAEDEGAGRCGLAGEPLTVADLAARTREFLNLSNVRVAGSLDQPVQRVAIACGSGGSFLPDAVRAGCQALVTGEATFHTCLEAEAQGVALVLPGHFASEQFALVALADYLSDQLADVNVWTSASESDPLESV